MSFYFSVDFTKKFHHFLIKLNKKIDKRKKFRQRK